MKKLLLLFFILSFLITDAQTPITATIGYQGYDETQAYFGEAEYQIFLDNIDGVLDKPIILVEGFDPSDQRDFTGMYNLLNFNGQNLGDTLRDEGFDFVLLNFPTYTRASDGQTVNGGADYIQRNAMVLTELINEINNQKIGSEELVIIGPSMGGLIARYALRYMEQNAMTHETRLYVSWDTPHYGANTPIGMQYFLNYTAESQNLQDLKDVINDTFNSPAGKEMLIDHFAAHLQSGSTFEQDPNILLPTGATNFRDAFQTELDAMGFPQNTRNIAISNGSSDGTGTGTPGMEIINHTFDLGNDLTADVILNFTPIANQSIVVTDVAILYLGFIAVSSYNANSLSPVTTDGVDAAPGGKLDLQTFGNTIPGNALLDEFVNNLSQSEYCFLPTISALAINETNWYAIPDINNSPFDAWSVPNINEEHVTLNQQNVDFTLAEIRNATGNINDTLLTNRYKIKENPIQNNLTVLLENTIQYQQITLNIVNVTGQKVFSKKYKEISNTIDIPLNLEKGVYFLNISDTFGQFSSKLIIQ